VDFGSRSDFTVDDQYIVDLIAFVRGIDYAPITNEGRNHFRIWGAHAPSRAGFGASPKQSLCGAFNEKVRDDEGVIAGTRGRVRSPEEDLALTLRFLRRDKGRPCARRDRWSPDRE